MGETFLFLKKYIFTDKDIHINDFFCNIAGLFDENNAANPVFCIMLALFCWQCYV